MITVKDYFAGLAMQELMRKEHAGGKIGAAYEKVCKEALQWAEAMMQARAGK